MKKALALVSCLVLIVGIAFGINKLINSSPSGPKTASLDQLKTFNEKIFSDKAVQASGIRLAEDPYQIISVVTADIKEQDRAATAVAENILALFFGPINFSKGDINKVAANLRKPLSKKERQNCLKFPGTSYLDVGDTVVMTKFLALDANNASEIVEAVAILAPDGTIKYTALTNLNLPEEAAVFYWENLCGPQK